MLAQLRPFLLSVVLAAGALTLAGNSAADGMRVAVVDVQRAVMQTEDGLRSSATLKKLFDQRQQELNRKQTEMEKQGADLEKQAKVISKDAYAKKREELQKQAIEYQAAAVEYTKELEKKQKEMTDPVLEKILGIVKRIATSENYDLVIDRATVAYSRGDLDLTDKCIQLYNSGGGGAAPAPSGSAARKK